MKIYEVKQQAKGKFNKIHNARERPQQEKNSMDRAAPPGEILTRMKEEDVGAWR